MPISTDSSLLAEYAQHLTAAGRSAALGDVLPILRAYAEFLGGIGSSVTSATRAEVEAYRAHLATSTSARSGATISVTTQGTRLGTVRAYHRWLHQRHHTLHDPAATVSPPSVPRKSVSVDHLTQLEARALLRAAANAVDQHRAGSRGRAIALRDLAMLALALATGRRATGLCRLHSVDLDVAERSLRVDREKGSPGRVLPVIDWAIAAVERYQAEGRPKLVGTVATPWLFIGRNSSQPVAMRTWDEAIRRLHRTAAARSPELDTLAAKTISAHSLRVTFATELFRGGCDIRVINELMLHRRLTTTATYTPLALADLRRGLIAHHPRA